MRRYVKISDNFDILINILGFVEANWGKCKCYLYGKMLYMEKYILPSEHI